MRIALPSRRSTAKPIQGRVAASPGRPSTRSRSSLAVPMTKVSAPASATCGASPTFTTRCWKRPRIATACTARRTRSATCAPARPGRDDESVVVPLTACPTAGRSSSVRSCAVRDVGEGQGRPGAVELGPELVGGIDRAIGAMPLRDLEADAVRARAQKVAAHLDPQPSRRRRARRWAPRTPTSPLRLTRSRDASGITTTELV